MTTPVDTIWTLQTARTPGAIALIQIDGDIDHALRALSIPPVGIGELRVRDLAGVDTGVVARWTDSCAHLMPHGGPAITRALIDALRRAGLAERSRATWPEATDEIESHMLDALSRTPSPIAIDLLLDQPRRWRERSLEPDDQLDRILARTLTPPVVVALGESNIGKSTLANELARSTVAIVADEPGTTRDHVGIDIDMAGLIVRYIDTPGRLTSPSTIDQDAADLVTPLLDRADLVLRCADARTTPPETTAPALTVALRTDLGAPPFASDVQVCARSGDGLDSLAAAIRDRLVPPEALADPRPWRFWPD